MSFKPEDVRIPYDWYHPTPEEMNAKKKEPAKAPSSLSPNHYARWKIEPLTFCMENNLPFWMGNIIKYIMRYDQKDGLQDLYKARVYLDRMIKDMEGKNELRR